jgi:hypothetical protein
MMRSSNVCVASRKKRRMSVEIVFLCKSRLTARVDEIGNGPCWWSVLPVIILPSCRRNRYDVCGVIGMEMSHSTILETCPAHAMRRSAIESFLNRISHTIVSQTHEDCMRVIPRDVALLSSASANARLVGGSFARGVCGCTTPIPQGMACVEKIRSYPVHRS